MYTDVQLFPSYISAALDYYGVLQRRPMFLRTGDNRARSLVTIAVQRRAVDPSNWNISTVVVSQHDKQPHGIKEFWK